MEKIILITFFSILITILFIYLLYFILKNISFNRKKYIFFSLELDTKRWIIKRNNSLLNNIIYDEKFNWYFKNKIQSNWYNKGHFLNWKAKTKQNKFFILKD